MDHVSPTTAPHASPTTAPHASPTTAPHASPTTAKPINEQVKIGSTDFLREQQMHALQNMNRAGRRRLQHRFGVKIKGIPVPVDNKEKAKR